MCVVEMVSIHISIAQVQEIFLVGGMLQNAASR